MKREYETNEELLTLGQITNENNEKEKQKNKFIFPICLMIIGFILMLIGYFFDDITKYLGISFNKTDVVVKEEKEKKELLKCRKITEENTLGIETIITYEYIFIDKKLQSLNEKRLIKVIEDSDIGSDNLKIINSKYTDIVMNFDSLSGIDISQKYKSDELEISIKIDYMNLDITKVPQNNDIKIENSYNELYRDVKKKLNINKNILCE